SNKADGSIGLVGSIGISHSKGTGKIACAAKFLHDFYFVVARGRHGKKTRGAKWRSISYLLPLVSGVTIRHFKLHTGFSIKSRKNAAGKSGNLNGRSYSCSFDFDDNRNMRPVRPDGSSSHSCIIGT